MKTPALLLLLAASAWCGDAPVSADAATDIVTATGKDAGAVLALAGQQGSLVLPGAPRQGTLELRRRQRAKGSVGDARFACTWALVPGQEDQVVVSALALDGKAVAGGGTIGFTKGVLGFTATQPGLTPAATAAAVDAARELLMSRKLLAAGTVAVGGEVVLAGQPFRLVQITPRSKGVSGLFISTLDYQERGIALVSYPAVRGLFNEIVVNLTAAGACAGWDRTSTVVEDEDGGRQSTLSRRLSVTVAP